MSAKMEDLVHEVNTYCYLADTALSPALKNRFKKRAEEAQEELDSLEEEAQ